MTLFRILEPITCTDSSECHEKIKVKIEVNRGLKMHIDDKDDPTDKNDAYLSIKHKQGNHLIILNVYDDETKHEYVRGLELSEFSKTGVLNPIPTKVKTTITDRVKRATARLPTLEELQQDVKDRDVP